MPPPAEPGFRLIGARRELFRDAYHAFLEASWPAAIAVIVAGWLLVNAIFGTAYHLVGGVTNVRPDMWRDAFYFSVQTLGTIGYGVMAPASDAAQVLVVIESATSLIVTALATGLVFAKFGRTRTRVVFATHAVIGPQHGVPTLSVRLGNERLNRIVDVRFALSLVRTDRTAEGQTFYRMLDLPLTRSSAASLRSAYILHHTIDARSPLWGYDPARFDADECEVHVVVTGIDETTLQPVHATRTYTGPDLRWNSRYEDMLRELPDGIIEVDLGKFHGTSPL